MSAVSIATRSVAPRALGVVRLVPHLIGLGAPYDALRAIVRSAAGVVGRARRRAHVVADPPRTIHESLGIGR
jgi:hypothetical protein